MTPRRRFAGQTGCAVPADLTEAARRVRDQVAELVVLSGLVRAPKQCGDAGLDALVTKGDFFFGHHQQLYDVLAWCRVADPAGPLLVAAWVEGRARKFCDLDRDGYIDLLMDAWFCNPWFPDIVKWAETPAGPADVNAWAATAAARKVSHLARRRATIHGALGSIRDALLFAGSTGEIGTDDLLWE